MSIKRTKLAEKKATVRLRRSPEKEPQKAATTAVVAFQQLAKSEAKARILPAQFHIMEMLGQGAMGTVYRVRDESVGNELAAKVLNEQWSCDAIALKRFEIEAAAAGELNHPNIAHVYSCSTESKTAFLLMEFVDGLSLAQILHRDRVIEPGKMVNLLLQICDALDYAHSRGVVHRDLKPSNIIVRELPTGNVAKLVDFGIAKVAPTNKSATQLTQIGQVFGTPSYMSPEQSHGSNIDHRSDLYSLGCILYEALAGKQLFPGENGVHIMLQHINVSPRKATKALMSKGYSRSLVAVLEKLLEKKPERRYQSASELADELQRIVQKKPTKALLRNPLMLDISRNFVIGGVATVSVLSAIAAGVMLFDGSGMRARGGAAPLTTESERLSNAQNEERQLIAKIAHGDQQSATFAAKALHTLVGAEGFQRAVTYGNGYVSDPTKPYDLLTQADQEVLIQAYKRSSDGLLRESLIGILGTTSKPTVNALDLTCSVAQREEVAPDEEGSEQPRSIARQVLRRWARLVSPDKQLPISTAVSKILLSDPESLQYCSEVAGKLSNFSDEAVRNFRKSAATITTDFLGFRQNYQQFTHPLLRVSQVKKQYYPELLQLAHRTELSLESWRTLRALGDKAVPAVPSLCRMLTNADDVANACAELGTIGKVAAPLAVPELRKVLYGEPDRVENIGQPVSVRYAKQAAAATALAKMGQDGEKILREAARSKSKISQIALESLNLMKQEKEFPLSTGSTVGDEFSSVGPYYSVR